MGRRIKRLRIEVEYIINLGVFNKKQPSVSFKTWVDGEYYPLPTDVKFVSMIVDPLYPGFLYIYLESEEWPVVESHREIPDLALVITAHYEQEEVKPSNQKQSTNQT